MSDSISWGSYQQGIKISYQISSADWYTLIFTCLENLVTEELNTIFSEFLLNTSIAFLSFRKCGLMMQGTRNLCQRILLSPGFRILQQMQRCCIKDQRKMWWEGVTGPSCLLKAEQTIWCHSWQGLIKPALNRLQQTRLQTSLQAACASALLSLCQAFFFSQMCYGDLLLLQFKLRVLTSSTLN